jgi:hypothetical protein
MSKYIKDPLDRRKTPYDFFQLGLDTTIQETMKRYKEIAPSDPESARQMLGVCKTVQKRLRVDFYYYCVPDHGEDGQ